MMEHDREFTEFPRLPREIRHMIWKAALPGPRVITIRQSALKATVEDVHRKTEAERSESLKEVVYTAAIARMRDGVGPHHFWRLPQLSTEQMQALSELLLRLEQADKAKEDDPYDDDSQGWVLETIMDIFPESEYTDRSIGDTILFHLTQGVPINIVRDFVGLSTEKGLFLIVGSANLRLWGATLTDLPVYKSKCGLQEPLLEIKPDRHSIQTLFVCRESREIAIQFYTKAFSTDTSLPRTYFDFQRDTLYLRYSKFPVGVESYDIFRCFPTSISCITDAENLSKIRNVAIQLDFSITRMSGGLSVFLCKWLASLFDYFGAIKTLTIVVDHYEDQGVKDEDPCLFFDPKEIWGAPKGDIPPSPALETPFQQFWHHQRSIEQSIDLDKLELCRSAPSPNGKAQWSIPTIEYKVAMTPKSTCEEDLDRFRHNYSWQSFLVENLATYRQWLDSKFLQ